MRSSSQPAAVGPELSPALAPLARWLGDWDASDGPGSEHWVAAAGAIYGVALHGDRFEVLVVDDGDGPGRPDGVLRLFAMPDGARTAELRQRRIADGAATFADDTHPRIVVSRKPGEAMLRQAESAAPTAALRKLMRESAPRR